MSHLTAQIDHYLDYCKYQKKLSEKSVKAYRIDLTQFAALFESEAEPLTKVCISQYIQALHQQYKPKTAKRKIACLRAFVNYLEFDEQIDINPINKIRLEFREPITLPKSLPLKTIGRLLRVAHQAVDAKQSKFQRKMRMRNVAVLELLFATGLRVSELCSLRPKDIDLKSGFIKVWGKGAKERIVFISNVEALAALRQYESAFSRQIKSTGWFFINRLGSRLMEQSVREMIDSYATLAKISEHVTPHMIRHTNATLLIASGAALPTVAKRLGHATTATTTSIYAHAIRSADEAAAETLENILNPLKKARKHHKHQINTKTECRAYFQK